MVSARRFTQEKVKASGNLCWILATLFPPCWKGWWCAYGGPTRKRMCYFFRDSIFFTVSGEVRKGQVRWWIVWFFGGGA